MFLEEELREAGKCFAIVGPRVEEADINTIFSGSFPGKEDLVQFYLKYNGGSRTPQGCVISCNNPAHKIARNNLTDLEVEGFMSVSIDPADRMLPFRPILGHRATMLRIYAEVPEMREFYEQNIPLAFGHSGEDLCANLKTGSIWYMDCKEYQLGAVELSPDFHDFVLHYWVHPQSPGSHGK